MMPAAHSAKPKIGNGPGRFGHLRRRWKSLFGFLFTCCLLITILIPSGCSANWSMSPFQPEPGTTPVYVSLVIHLEESFPQNARAFARTRGDLLEIADFCLQHQLRFNLQTDWAFMTAMQQFETPEMRAQTGGKNLLLYLREDCGMEIDPHSHEHRYNYADLAFLLDSCGIEVSNIAGGLIAAPAELSQLERFQAPIKGKNFDYVWQPDYLWGGGTPNHRDEPAASGIWFPLDRGHYYENGDGSSVSIPAIGGYTGEISDIYKLVDKIAGGQAPAGHCYTACIMFNQGRLKQDLLLLQEEISRLEQMQAEGSIRFVSLQELIQVWQTDYDSAGFVYTEENKA